MGEAIEYLVGCCEEPPTAYMNNMPVMEEFVISRDFNLTLEIVEVDPENLLLTYNAMTKDQTLVYPPRNGEDGALTEAVIRQTKRLSESIDGEESHLLNAIGLSLHGHRFGSRLWLEGLKNIDQALIE
jgi:hypothetical protein